MPETLVRAVRVAPGIDAALKVAAERDGLSLSQWASRAIRGALQAQGYSVADIQYALVANGALVLGQTGFPITTHRPDSDPRGEWLPVENEDSDPCLVKAASRRDGRQGDLPRAACSKSASSGSRNTKSKATTDQ
jgi:hypothetical protein